MWHGKVKNGSLVKLQRCSNIPATKTARRIFVVVVEMPVNVALTTAAEGRAAQAAPSGGASDCGARPSAAGVEASCTTLCQLAEFQ